MDKEKSLLSNELRISVTNKCNYKCVFCHNDGINPDEKITEFNNTVLDLIEMFIKSGGNDITLTGGEPLLSEKTTNITTRLISFIRKDLKSEIPITIVSNGALINEKMVRFFKDVSNLKFNLSIHSFRPKTYLEITKQNRWDIEKIIENVQLLRKNKIAFKINYVVLKGINNSAEDLIDAIRQSYNLGSTAIKFIEFLITDHQQNMLNNYYELKSVESLLKNNLTLIGKSDRKAKYKYVDSETEQNVEIVRCTCKVGCRNCLKYRPIAIDIECNYHPCFISQEEKLQIKSKDQIEPSLKEGLKYINFLASKYEDMSPILNNDPVLKPEKLNIYCEVDENIYNNIIRDKEKYLKIRYINHNYYFFIPKTADESWKKFRKSVRIRENLNNLEQSALIVSENELLERDGIPVIKTLYSVSNDYLMEDKKENIEKILRHLDYDELMNYNIEGFYIIHNYLRLNISKIAIKGKIIFMLSIYPRSDKEFEEAKNLISQLRVKPIETTLFEFLMNY